MSIICYNTFKLTKLPSECQQLFVMFLEMDRSYRDAGFVRVRPQFSGKDHLQLASFSLSFHEIQAERIIYLLKHGTKIHKTDLK